MSGLDPEYEKSRYSEVNVLRSETIYGHGFQSAGGASGVAWCCDQLLGSREVARTGSGVRVLDIGSGSGGTAFYLQDHYSARVTGVDLSRDMVDLSRARALESGRSDVHFILGDVFHRDLDGESFHLVWSRDTLMYESRKLKTLRRVKELIGSGGWFLLSDQCQSRSSPDFETYMTVSNFHLASKEEYEDLLGQAGFDIIKSMDISRWTQDQLIADLDSFVSSRSVFLRQYGPEDYQHIVNRWQTKINFIKRNELTEGLFLARG